MEIEKRMLRNGKTVGWNVKRKCYCPLPDEMRDAPFSQLPLAELNLDDLKAIASEKGLAYHWNTGKEKLIALIEEAQKEV